MKDRHIVVTGDHQTATNLLTAALRREGIIVSADATHEASQQKPAFVVLAEQFSSHMDWDQWFDSDSRNEHTFRALLPRLAPVSNGLLLGFNTSNKGTDRAKVRDGMTALISRFQADAAQNQGIDFSLNGIEIPATHDRILLEQRLREHASRRSVLGNGIVVHLEDLNHYSIVEAITADYI